MVGNVRLRRVYDSRLSVSTAVRRHRSYSLIIRYSVNDTAANACQHFVRHVAVAVRRFRIADHDILFPQCVALHRLPLRYFRIPLDRRYPDILRKPVEVFGKPQRALDIRWQKLHGHRADVIIFVEHLPRLRNIRQPREIVCYGLIHIPDTRDHAFQVLTVVSAFDYVRLLVVDQRRAVGIVLVIDFRLPYACGIERRVRYAKRQERVIRYI